MSARRRWFLLAAGWALLLVLGIQGFLQQADDAGLDRSGLDVLYLTMQLAALDYGGGDTALNWRLEIARFVAPMMAAGTLLQTASVVFRDQFARFRARFRRGHTVVCGLGTAGSRLAVALAGAGHRVVAVERDPASPGAAQARGHEIPVLTGDATDHDLLRAAGVDRATRLVAVDDDDATNVSIALAVRALPRRGAGPLRCSIRLDDADMCALLRGGDLAGGAVRLDFFNLQEAAARAWLAEHPPFGDGSRPPHLAVVGLGQLGRGLVVAAAQQWAENGEGQLRLTLVDRVASGRWHALRLQHPALPSATETLSLDLDLDEPDGAAVDAFTTVLDTDPPTAVAITFEDETLALSSALLVHQAVRGRDVEVVVRVQEDVGLAALVTPPGLSLFPVLDKACTPAIVEGGVREQLARALHEDYLARVGADGTGYRRPWEELTDEERELSRSTADGAIAGLGAIGCDLVPLRRWGAPAVELTDDEVETLARLEHERWFADRTAAGWTWAEVRDDQKRTNPLLLPWDELPEATRGQNRGSSRALPGMLARAGFEPARR